MKARQGAKLVRYVSPFGSPAWMTRDEAQHYLDEDDAHWLEFLEIERETGCKILSEHQRAIGPPRMEHLS